MKILAISLLRLGDILMTVPVLNALRRKFPDGEIHILINNQFQSVADLIPGVDRVHCFPRGLLQQSLTDPAVPLMDAFYRLDAIVKDLRDERFDQVLNLTHNRLTGYLTSLIGAQDSTGLQLGPQEQVAFGSPWFRYLNERADSVGEECFHYSDVFLFGSGFGSADREFRLQTTESGEREADTLLEGIERPILLQPFTSDEKKDWSAEGWVSLAKSLSEDRLSEQIFFLGAPFEKEKLGALQSELRQQGVSVRTAICSLAGALSLIQRARLLVTGDTAIKHLAAATACPVVELSLGSSDWRRTGIYKDNSFILQPKTDCHPCVHSQSCPKERFLCKDDLDFQTVLQVVRHVLNPDYSLRPSATVQIIKTFTFQGGHWQGIPLASESELDEVRSMLDRVTLKLLLTGEHRKSLGAFGTEGLRIGEALREKLGLSDTDQWNKVLDKIEEEIRNQELEAEDARRRFDRFMRESRADGVVDLKAMRQLQQKLEDCNGRILIRKKLLRSIRGTAAEAK